MSYDQIEQSVEDGSVIELYEFVQGIDRYLYCSCESEVEFQSRIFNPFAGTRKQIKQTADVLKDSISFTFPRGDEFASQFLGFAPDQVITVTIYRGHSTDSTNSYAVYWKGRVLGTSTSGNEINIDCESVFTSIKRYGLRARYLYNCRHSLYSVGCNVNRESFKVQGSVISTSGNVLTVQGLASYSNGYFTGGIVIAPSGTNRFITKHESDIITVSRPINELIGNQIVTVYPGCDHSLSACDSKFNNLDNFGGFPWIPVKNPFGGSSIM